MRSVFGGACLLALLGCESSRLGVAEKTSTGTAQALVPTCTNGTGETFPKTFENGVEGAVFDSKGDTTGDYYGTWTKPLEVRVRGAGKALAADVQFGPPKANLVWIRVPVCKAGGTADMRGKSFSASVYVDGPALPAPRKVWLGAMIPDQWGLAAQTIGAPIKADHVLRGTVPANDGAAKMSEIILTAAVDGAHPWTGTLFFDDVSFE